MISYTPEELVFTSSIPEVIEIELQGEEMIEARVYLRDALIYKTTIEGDGGRFLLYGVREAIEEKLKKRGGIAKAEILIDGDNGAQESVQPFNVHYAEVKIEGQKELEYWCYNFLTTRRTFEVPEDAVVVLPFLFDNRGNDDTRVIKVLYKQDGKISLWENRTSEQTERIIDSGEITIDLQQLKARIDNEDGEEVESIKEVTVEAENRSVYLYVKEGEPEHFRFRNAFGLWEEIYVWGKTTTKTTRDFKEATCEGITSQYDQTAQTEYEVETSIMREEEARAFMAFIRAEEITRVSGGREEKVLITDSTAEMETEPGEEIKMKFTWTYTDKAKRIQGRKPRAQVFNNNYSSEYE